MLSNTTSSSVRLVLHQKAQRHKTKHIASMMQKCYSATKVKILQCS